MKKYIFITYSAISFIIGLMVYTFFFAKGYSYFTDNPISCVNCHIMEEQYKGWSTGPHRNTAVCNDCHSPPNLFSKYLTKSINGFNHALAFTTGHYDIPIKAKSMNKNIAEESCIRCHSEIFFQPVSNQHTQKLSCQNCHTQVWH